MSGGVRLGHTAGMDLRHLRTFEAVARTGSFTAAAAELGFTQSAVSQHVAALETDLGRALLTRRPVALTADGARLAAHARQILLRVDVARTELRPRPAAAGALRVAVTALALGPRVAVALARLRHADPRVRVDLVDCPAPEALRRLAAGAVDAVLLAGVSSPNGPLAAGEPGVLGRRVVAEEPLVVLMPAGHPLAALADVPLDALRDAHWVDAPALRCDPSAVPGAGFLPSRVRVRYDGGDVGTLAQLVAAGLGLALLPRDVAPLPPGAVAVPLRDGVVHRVELLTVPGGGAAAPLLDALGGG